MAITAVTLKWSLLLPPTFEVEIFDRLVLAIFLLVSLFLFAIISLASLFLFAILSLASLFVFAILSRASLFLFAIFMSLVSLFKYGIALFGLG